MAKIIRRLLPIFVILLSVAIGCLGTETGNPDEKPGVDTETPGTGDGAPTSGDPIFSNCPLSTTPQEQVAAELPETELDELIERLCLSIFLCDPAIGTLECIDALSGPDGDLILNEFGVLPEGILTVDQVDDGLQQGILEVDPVAFEACKRELLAIECTDIVVHVSADDFSSVENIIPLACADVFLDLPEEVLETCQ